MEEAEESETCWLFEELRRVGASNLPRVASTWMFKAGLERNRVEPGNPTWLFFTSTQSGKLLTARRDRLTLPGMIGELRKKHRRAEKGDWQKYEYGFDYFAIAYWLDTNGRIKLELLDHKRLEDLCEACSTERNDLVCLQEYEHTVTPKTLYRLKFTRSTHKVSDVAELLDQQPVIECFVVFGEFGSKVIREQVCDNQALAHRLAGLSISVAKAIESNGVIITHISLDYVVSQPSRSDAEIRLLRAPVVRYVILPQADKESYFERIASLDYAAHTVLESLGPAEEAERRGGVASLKCRGDWCNLLPLGLAPTLEEYASLAATFGLDTIASTATMPVNNIIRARLEVRDAALAHTFVFSERARDHRLPITISKKGITNSFHNVRVNALIRGQMFFFAYIQGQCSNDLKVQVRAPNGHVISIYSAPLSISGGRGKKERTSDTAAGISPLDESVKDVDIKVGCHVEFMDGENICGKWILCIQDGGNRGSLLYHWGFTTSVEVGGKAVKKVRKKTGQNLKDARVRAAFPIWVSPEHDFHSGGNGDEGAQHDSGPSLESPTRWHSSNTLGPFATEGSKRRFAASRAAAAERYITQHSNVRVCQRCFRVYASLDSIRNRHLTASTPKGGEVQTEVSLRRKKSVSNSFEAGANAGQGEGAAGPIVPSGTVHSLQLPASLQARPAGEGDTLPAKQTLQLLPYVHLNRPPSVGWKEAFPGRWPGFSAVPKQNENVAGPPSRILKETTARKELLAASAEAQQQTQHQRKVEGLRNLALSCSRSSILLTYIDSDRTGVASFKEFSEQLRACGIRGHGVEARTDLFRECLIACGLLTEEDEAQKAMKMKIRWSALEVVLERLDNRRKGAWRPAGRHVHDEIQTKKMRKRDRTTIRSFTLPHPDKLKGSQQLSESTNSTSRQGTPQDCRSITPVLKDCRKAMTPKPLSRRGTPALQTVEEDTVTWKQRIAERHDQLWAVLNAGRAQQLWRECQNDLNLETEPDIQSGIDAVSAQMAEMNDDMQKALTRLSKKNEQTIRASVSSGSQKSAASVRVRTATPKAGTLIRDLQF